MARVELLLLVGIIVDGLVEANHRAVVSPNKSMTEVTVVGLSKNVVVQDGAKGAEALSSAALNSLNIRFFLDKLLYKAADSDICSWSYDGPTAFIVSASLKSAPLLKGKLTI